MFCGIGRPRSAQRGASVPYGQVQVQEYPYILRFIAGRNFSPHNAVYRLIHRLYLEFLCDLPHHYAHFRLFDNGAFTGHV